MNPFEELLKELGNYLGITLQPDSNQSCKLAFFDNTLFVQIDLTPTAEQILLGCELGEIPPGPYREKVALQALIMNGSSEQSQGILAFSAKKNALILFQFLPLMHLTGEKLYHVLQLFTQHALLWVEAIQKGEIPVLEESDLSSSLAAPFEIKK